MMREALHPATAPNDGAVFAASSGRLDRLLAAPAAFAILPISIMVYGSIAVLLKAIAADITPRSLLGILSLAFFAYGVGNDVDLSIAFDHTKLVTTLPRPLAVTFRIPLRRFYLRQLSAVWWTIHFAAVAYGALRLMSAADLITFGWTSHAAERFVIEGCFFPIVFFATYCANIYLLLTVRCLVPKRTEWLYHIWRYRFALDFFLTILLVCGLR